MEGGRGDELQTLFWNADVAQPVREAERPPQTLDTVGGGVGRLVVGHGEMSMPMASAIRARRSAVRGSARQCAAVRGSAR